MLPHLLGEIRHVSCGLYLIEPDADASATISGMRLAEHRMLSLLAAFIALPVATFAQLNVLMSGGFAAPYQELLPAFEKSTGITVKTSRGASEGSGPTTIPTQLRNGSDADMVIMSKEGLNALIAENWIDWQRAVDLAQAPLGVAVRAGAPKPDISTAQAFKQTLLRAKSVNIVSTTGIYATQTLFPKLGISAEMAGKIKDVAVSGLANGEVEIALRPVSEIMNVPGVDFVGTVPKEIQFASIFTAAVTTNAQHSEAAKRLIAFLSSESAKAAIQKSGMDAHGGPVWERTLTGR